LIAYLASCALPPVAFGDCAHEIIDQAYKGSITRHYSQDCYTAAIRIEPVDGSSYSDIDAIIKDAKRADALRIAISAARTGGANTGHVQHTRPPQTAMPGAAASPAARTTNHREPPPSPRTMLAEGSRDRPAAAVRHPAASPPAKVGVTPLDAPSATPVLQRLAPAHAGDVPLAVIVLGVLATLLVLAGLAGAIARRRARRHGA
jgi:hypothetical protein